MEDSVVSEKVENIQKRENMKWVKGDSGTTYLCKTEDLQSLKNPTEEELKRICVDESNNPQND